MSALSKLENDQHSRLSLSTVPIYDYKNVTKTKFNRARTVPAKTGLIVNLY